MGGSLTLPQQVRREAWVPAAPTFESSGIDRRATVTHTAIADDGEEVVQEIPHLVEAVRVCIDEWVSRLPTDPEEIVEGTVAVSAEEEDHKRSMSEDTRRQSSSAGHVVTLTGYRLQIHTTSHRSSSDIIPRAHGSTSVVLSEGVGRYYLEEVLKGGQMKEGEWMYNLDSLDKEFRKRDETKRL
eukprot:PhM_4_TR14595/c0_g1_i2/m.97916